MKKFVPIILIIAISLFSILANSLGRNKNVMCDNCNEEIDGSFEHCPNCGSILKYSENEEALLLSNEQKIIGTWVHVHSEQNFVFTFYSDGSCQSQSLGNGGGYYPSLYLYSYREGSGDGYWSFVDNKLKIEYQGEYKGTQYYDFSFNEDNTEMLIDSAITWFRYPEEAKIDAFDRAYLKLTNEDGEILSQSGFIGHISNAELEVKDGSYKTTIYLTEFGKEEFNKIYNLYPDEFTLCFWAGEEFIMALITDKDDFNGKTLSFSCSSRKSAELITYKINQASTMQSVKK